MTLTEKYTDHKLSQIRNADAAAIGNEEIAKQVEVTTGQNTEEKKQPHEEDPDIFIGQKPDESPEDTEA